MARPPVYLITGPAELLVRRRADALVEELAAEGDIEVIDVRAPELTDEVGFPDLRTASLFGGRRVVLVREAGELSATIGASLLAEIEAGPLDATVILLATSTGRITKLARAIKQLGGRIDEKPPPDFDDRGWEALASGEFSRHGRAASRAAVEAILAHAGHDVDGIAEKVAQVCSATPDGTIDADQVNDVVTGHGSRGSFAIADAMCRREPEAALTLLRGAIEAGDDPIMILGALAYRIRGLVAAAAKARKDPPFDPAEAGLKISPGQWRFLERDRRNFGPGELTSAYRTLADADAELKGGELPPELVIERAVVAIATKVEQPSLL